MSAYPHFYQYPEQPQVSLTSNAFGYSQYDSPRSKTPTSLVNHSGFSPGPLSTPPPLSRNTSQPPEQLSKQSFEQMAWDDVVGSISDSPTSVRTPDNEAFDFEMLEATESMRGFYESQNSAMMTTHVSHQALPTLDTAMFITDQAIAEAFNGALAAQPQQHHALFSVQSQTPLTAVAPQPYNQFYGEAYTRQPPRQDPWTGQGPPRNPNAAQPGMAVFDPASDPMDYNDFGNFDNIDDWRMNNTDPNYLVSPNDPVAPTHDNLFYFPPQNHAPVYPQSHNHLQSHLQNHSPVEMTLTLSSPSPDSQRFVNYTSSSAIFTDNYITDSQFPPPSPVASSAGHGALSPYQAPISPQGSALSPDGSEGMFSYQHSDGDMLVDSYVREDFESQPSLSPVQVHRAPRRVSEVTLGLSPEPESQRAHSISSKGAGGRPGGRSLGTHLDPKVAKAAHDMRKISACWHCVLQRDKCGPGDVCERCLKRSQRPNADCGIGCVREKLVNLTSSFLPTLVTQMHEDSHLTHFVSQFIHQWQNVEITIYMTCGQKTMPRIPVKVYEFVPNGDELLVQIQYKTDPATLQRVPVKKKSPALGMVHINHNEEKKYDKYINDIVDNHLDAFGLLCWAEDDNDFQEKLFKLMTRLKPKKDDEAKLFREVFRLIVCTFIMSHTLTIAEETKDRSLSKMHSYTGRDAYVAYNTSPRMTNRQLKYFFSRLQRSIMSTILNKLQQIYKSSRGCDKWLPAFVVVVGMCMAHEDQQKIIHQTMATKATTEHTDPRDAQARADIACREIDARMNLIKDIFRHKYHRKCNPLRDADHDWEREAGFGDPGSATFVRQVAQLVKENIDFLQGRQNVSISVDNQSKYTSRLVGQFLLSFWLPV